MSNKYRNLAQNTAIFAIGTFSSKLLVFIMMPIYTRALSTAEYGTVDLIQQISNLLVPIVTLGVTNALIRFGLDKSFRKNDVFTTGIICFLGGFSLLLCFSPLIHMISVTSDHTVMLYFFVLMSAMREMCSQFSRAKGYVKLYAFDGFLTTFMTCLLTIIFLMGFKWGINGYLSAIIITDALSSLFLFFSARLYKNIKFKGLDKRTFKMMLRYAIPMIPTTLLWWIVSVSDRYIITYMLGADANGLYAAAYKIPTIVVLVSTIFMDAWQVSAVSEIKDRKALAKFFSNVFRGYQSIIFLAGSLLIPFSKICTIILVAGDYYESWRYIPFLMLATIYNCMVQFMGSVYMNKIMGVASPKVGLLNVGAEEEKGRELEQETYALLKNSTLNFTGNVEARNAALGEVDVVVTDGFTGNIYLKTVEGMGKFMKASLKKIFFRNLGTKIGAMFTMKGIKEISKQMDYRETGGSPLLGTAKPVLKAHGSSDALAFKNAVRQAKDFVERNVIAEMEKVLSENTEG